MNIKKHIPNFLTCCNLLCGCLGLLFAFYAQTYKYLIPVSYFIFAACLFDFFDGFAARLLKVSSPIGKELDSLADVVTFGVLPSVVIYKLMEFYVTPLGGHSVHYLFFNDAVKYWPLPLPNVFDLSFVKYHPFIESIAFIIAIFSALRLAKFNVDTRQSNSFIGLPTPANAILIASFPLIFSNQTHEWTQLLKHPYFLIGLTLIMSYLLIAELPLFALKFKSFKWADNQIRFIFLISSVILFIFLTWTAIPIIIFLYVILSVIENKLIKPKIS